MKLPLVQLAVPSVEHDAGHRRQPPALDLEAAASPMYFNINTSRIRDGHLLLVLVSWMLWLLTSGA